ncbi:MAG: heavy-metal-associated domain-containing protein [Pseudomonadota bacterium]
MVSLQTSFAPDAPALKKAIRAPRVGVRWAIASIIALLLLGGAYAIGLAQVSGERGIAPTASSSDIEVRNIKVDERGDDAEDARSNAWRDAQRQAWKKVNGPPISDGQLSSMVSAIVIQRERVGPKRYIATLGVIFDRQRAGRYLGRGSQARASAPMLLIPVTASAGTYTAFEQRNPWQRAWADFNPGTSRIDYVRPTGAGGDSLLLNFGQTGRRSRAWWRSTLDQYSAADVITAIARLEHEYPGGPIAGTFIARYGPSNTTLESFTMKADSPDDLPDMLGEAVVRMDTIFEEALTAGKLKPDPTLRLGGSSADPAIARLVEIGRAIRARDAAARRAAEGGDETAESGSDEQTQPAGPEPAAASNFTVQFATPDAGTFDAAISGVRGAAGVGGVSVTSTAIGGTSVMSVSFTGSLDELAAALRARGFTVSQGAGALAISR